MKILFVNQSLGIGGAESFNRDLVKWFRKNDYEVSCFVTNRRFAAMLGSDTKIIPVVLDVIGNWKGLVKAMVLWPWTAFEYFKIVWVNRDSIVIYMTGFIEKIFVTPIAYVLKIPVVWVEFAPLKTIFTKFFGLPNFLYRSVSWMPKTLIMPTENTRQKNINILGVAENKIKIIPCGLDINIKKYSEIKPVRHSVCCVSRIEKGKGQDILIAAWPKVLNKFPDAILYIVGEGDKLPATPGVIFTGRVSDALQYIAESEIFVFPSIWPLEGFGLTVIEAMALARPVVAFKMGPVPEIIDNTTGILVEQDLDKAIITLLEHPDLAHKLGLAGQLKYQKQFTLDKIGPQYAKVFTA